MDLCKLDLFVKIGVVLLFAVTLWGQGSEAIRLPEPDTEGGKPLMQALKARRSTRSFSLKELTRQQLSDLLWAANGINRPAEGKRTAPSAHNNQEIDIYVALKAGLFLYDAKGRQLQKISAEDVRSATGGQGFVKDAPLNLIYVADYSRMGGSQTSKDFYAATDTGFIGQNVYLYCASAGLATVVRGWVDRDRLAKVMGLADHQKIILAQTVGYPK